MGRLITAGLVTLLTLMMIGGLTVFFVLEHYSRDLPSIEKLKNYQPPVATRLYAGDGRLLAEYATQKRVFVPLKAIPLRVRQAFIAIEDKNFYTHPGIDFFALVRAVAENASNMASGGRMVGASTITQQVVKNFLLTSERTLDRKVKEAILAFRITKALSKDQVLELYLNDIYLGFGSYGVAAAALNYFDKSLDELTLEEAAFIAGLPKAPGNYNPHRFYDKAKARRDAVIIRMREDGYITPEDAQAAIATPIVTRDVAPTEFANAAFFAEEVRRKLVEMYGVDALYEGGLSVSTTVDPTLQKYARDALRDTLKAYDKRRGFRGALVNIGTDNWLEGLGKIVEKRMVPLTGEERLAVVLALTNTAARIGFVTGLDGTLPFEQMRWASSKATKPGDVLKPGDVIIVAAVKDDANAEVFELRQVPAVNGAIVVLNPHTGRVLAMVGGYAYENTEFNRATQAMRQPGSAFKPFVYLAGLEAGFTPSSILMDAPIEVYQGAGLPRWRPKNYGGDFLGPTTLRRGLETSRNVMTVRLALQLGMKRIEDVAQRFGVYDKMPSYFSSVLGSQETTLLRLTNAYAQLVNGGKKVTPALIERIQDRNGKTIYRRDKRICEGCQSTELASPVSEEPPLLPDEREQVVDPAVAYQLVSMMEGVVQRGTATRARALNRPVAGKTGTTNDSRDAWFIGFTPDLVAGIYIGFDQPRTLGKRETGGVAALPGFVEFMSHALKDRPAVPFRIPSGVRLVKIDKTTGQPVTAETLPANVFLEVYREGQVPGAVPLYDVSSPASEGFGETAPAGSAQPYFPTEENAGQSSSPVVGTGGLY